MDLQLFDLNIKNKAHEAVERLEGKILYPFMHLVTGFDMKALVIVSGKLF